MEARIIKFKDRAELELSRYDPEVVRMLKMLEPNNRWWNKERGRWHLALGVTRQVRKMLEELGYTVGETLG